MIRRICFILVLTGLLGFNKASAQWSIEKSPTTYNLKTIYSIDKNIIWIAGDKGTLLHKLNNRWESVQNVTTENLNSIFMLDTNNGWAVGSNGTIIHFDGKEWNKVVCQTSKNLLSVFFRNPENGIIVGENGTILYFENDEWHLLETQISGDLHTVYFNDDNAWIGGGLECVNFPIMKLEIKKNMNMEKNFSSFSSIYDISFLSPSNAWAVGSPSTLLHFNGLDWEKEILAESFSSLRSVFFLNYNNGISTGYGGTILIFSEGEWKKQNSPVNITLNDATIAGRTYYIVGDNGTILSSSQGSEEEKSPVNNRSTKIEIEAYPNPSNDYLNVSIPDIYNFKAEEISITNIYGRVIYAKNLDAIGDGQIYRLNTSEFKNGFYLLRIKSSDNQVVESKFIVKH